jgi:hypothetical protein
MVAGTTQTLTIRAFDYAGTLTDCFDGAKAEVFSGANSISIYNPTAGGVAFGATGSVTFADGVGTTSMTLYRAQTAAVQVTKGFVGTNSALTVVVSPANAASMATYNLPSTVMKSAVYNIEVNLSDTYTNIATGYTGTVEFASTDLSPKAFVPANYTYGPSDAGEHNFTSAVSFNTPGSQTVTVRDTVNPSLTCTIDLTVLGAYDPPDNPEPPTPPVIESSPDIAIGNWVSDEDEMWRKRYLKGKYRTVVIVFEGKVVMAPYDEHGVNEEEAVVLLGGQQAQQQGEVK